MELQIYAKIPQFKFDRGPLRDAIRAELEETKKDFEKTVETWNHKPEFEARMKSGNQFMESGEIVVKEAGDKPIYKYIDEGTGINYAHMTHDFEPKTTPRQIQSQRGRGGLAYVDIDNPNPGIQARRFTRTIADKHRSAFRRRVKAIRAKGLIRRHGIRTIGSLANP